MTLQCNKVVRRYSILLILWLEIRGTLNIFWLKNSAYARIEPFQAKDSKVLHIHCISPPPPFCHTLMNTEDTMQSSDTFYYTPFKTVDTDQLRFEITIRPVVKFEVSFVDWGWCHDITVMDSYHPPKVLAPHFSTLWLGLSIHQL